MDINQGSNSPEGKVGSKTVESSRVRVTRKRERACTRERSKRRHIEREAQRM